MTTPKNDFQTVLKAVEAGQAKDRTRMANIIVVAIATTLVAGTIAGLVA